MERNRITGVAWFNGRGSIGIVTCIMDGEEKAYISTVNGEHELGDTIHVAEWGSYFPFEEAKSIIEKLGTPQNIEL